MRLIGGIILSLTVMSASAEIYRWKDANGNWQFGDKAPKEQHDTLDVKAPPKLVRRMHAIFMPAPSACWKASAPRPGKKPRLKKPPEDNTRNVLPNPARKHKTD